MRNKVSCFMSALLLGLLGALSAQAAGQQNDDYLIERDSINAGGQISTSSAYILTGSIGQPFAAGRSDSSLHINFSGFWGGGAAPTTYTVTVTIDGEGRVSGTGIDCPGDCSHQYAEGADLILSPAADPCRHFVEWRLDGSPVSGPIVVDRDITVTAVFAYCCPEAFSLLSPADQAGNQSLNVDLAWDTAAGATSYTVSFGTSSPPPELEPQWTGTSYDPGALEPGTTYYWRIGARNDCDVLDSEEWSFTTTHLPQITSDPPAMVNRTYEYDVDASDPDGDALSFSLSDAPDGMTIDPVSGLIVWTAAPDQIGNFNPTVTVADTRGGTASQTIPLTVTAETFTTMTVAFLEGVNLQDGATEQDNTVLSLGVGADLSGVTDIVLPNMENLFTFSALASFHVELQGGVAVIVPEPGVVHIAEEDSAGGGKAFEAILAGNLNELNWTTPNAVAVTDTNSIVFERSDGTYLKTGHFTLNLTEGTLTFAYADVTP